jgi:hypothetical protein
MKKKNAQKNFTEPPEGANIAHYRLKLIDKLQKAKEQREIDRKADWNANFIEGFDYASNLSNFREKLIAKKGTESPNQFLAYLVDQKNAYSNLASFYLIWGGSPAEEMRGVVFEQIADYIQSEIDEHIQPQIRPKKPEPVSLKNLLTEKGASILAVIKSELDIRKPKQLWHLYKVFLENHFFETTELSNDAKLHAFKQYFPGLTGTRQAFERNQRKSKSRQDDILLLKQYSEIVNAALLKNGYTTNTNCRRV